MTKRRTTAGNQKNLPGVDEPPLTAAQELGVEHLNKLVKKRAAGDEAHESENALKLFCRKQKIDSVKVKDDNGVVHEFIIDPQTHVRHKTRRSKSDKKGTAVTSAA